MPPIASRDRFDEAMANFRKALEIKPNYAEAHYHMGLALADKGRLADAIASYRKALTIKPDYAEARKHLNQATETRP
jgi:protein O-GlcNAc transferase